MVVFLLFLFCFLESYYFLFTLKIHILCKAVLKSNYNSYSKIYNTCFFLQVTLSSQCQCTVNDIFRMMEVVPGLVGPPGPPGPTGADGMTGAPGKTVSIF